MTELFVINNTMYKKIDFPVSKCLILSLVENPDEIIFAITKNFNDDPQFLNIVK